MKIRPATRYEAYELKRAIAFLKNARLAAVSAHCPKLADKIRSALKSAEGAGRHMRHRIGRTNADGTTRGWQ